jgi:hypothetical protein
MVASDQRFCRECGREIAQAAATQQDAFGEQAQGAPQGCPMGSWTSGPARWPVPPYRGYGMVRRGHIHPLLIVLAAFLLVPLAIPLFLGTLFAGFAVLGLAFKLAPMILIGLGIYWLLSRPRRVTHV